MTVANQITECLHIRFAPLHVAVTDDSAKHAGHAGAQPGGNTHFSVFIVSDAFQGMSRVARHRAVYEALAVFFQNGLHALAIDAKTPQEMA